MTYEDKLQKTAELFSKKKTDAAPDYSDLQRCANYINHSLKNTEAANHNMTQQVMALSLFRLSEQVEQLLKLIGEHIGIRFQTDRLAPSKS